MCVCVCVYARVPQTPWDRPLSELRTSPAFVSLASSGQQEREEEQTLNKNIVCLAWRQSAALYTTEEESCGLMLALKGRERAVGHAGMAARTNKLEIWGKVNTYAAACSR